MLNRSLLLFSLVFLPGVVLGQYGKIQGQLTDQATDEPLIGAVVFTTSGKGANTNDTGKFSIEGLTRGTYTLVFRYIGFKTDTLTGIEVKPNQVTTVNFKMQPEDMAVEGTEIVTKRANIESSNISMVSSIKLSETVDVGISKEQIQNSQDRTAAQVMRRVPGISLANSRFVTVRGLSPRYSQVLLNGALTPSVETDVRSFSFDIIPSSLIEEVTVTKTPVPHLPGDFAGGMVQIHTLDIPERDITQIGYSTGYRLHTTLKDGFRGDTQNPGDILGDGSADRQLPADFPADLSAQEVSRADQAAAGRALPNTWAPQDLTAIPDQRANVLFSRAFGKKIRVGTTTALRYSLTNQYYEAERLNYEFANAGEQADTIFAYNDQQYERRVRISALHNWTLQFNRNHRLKIDGLFNQNGRSQVTERSGVVIDNQEEVRNTALRYRTRRLMTANLSGEHLFMAQRLKLDWGLGLGASAFEEPDFRIMAYQREAGTTVPFAFPDNQDAVEFGGRYYGDMNEQTQNGRFNLQYTIRDKEGLRVPFYVKVGGFWERRRREFDARLLTTLNAAIPTVSTFNDSLNTLPLETIFAPANFYATPDADGEVGYLLSEVTQATDSYAAEQDLYATYAAVNIPLSDLLSVYTGVRLEHNTQRLSSTLGNGDSVNVNNPILSILPSLNAKLRLSEKWQLRMGYGMSVNRPEFRELAPFSYLDFFQNVILRGNDTLATPKIHNADFRAEFFPNPGEMITVGVFYKQFIDPIEWFFIPGVTSGGTRNYTFINAKGATAYGAELEYRQALGNFIDQPVLRDLSVFFNAAYIFTRMDLGDAEAIRSEDPNRPLQGQSPYLINGGLAYDNTQIGLSGSVNYNVFGPRLLVAGVTGIPSIYEVPRNQLDITIRKTLGRYLTLKAGVQNLLNAVWEQRQDDNNNGKIDDTDLMIESYKLGQYFTLGFTIDLSR